MARKLIIACKSRRDNNHYGIVSKLQCTRVNPEKIAVQKSSDCHPVTKPFPRFV